MDNYIFESEGKTKAEAEERATEVLGVSADDLDFRPVGPKQGLLGLVSRKPVVLRVFPKETTPVEALIKGTAVTVIRKMGLDATVTGIRYEEDNIILELESPDSGILIGKRGRTLDALQFVVNLLVHSKVRHGKRVMLDIEGYRGRRQCTSECVCFHPVRGSGTLTNKSKKITNVREKNQSDQDTIIAAATPHGRGAVSVIRLSGPDVIGILKTICRNKTGRAPDFAANPRHAFLCTITAPDGPPIDTSLVTFFPGPASYTGEDTAEISTHGNMLLVRQVIGLVADQGLARPAGPGEFTRRAFLNGKMDLSQAEAVKRIIEA
ncbi:MAG: KH domain-containing protein, partial [Spirochaetia bacterium]|nr:KH domain-containing protein [Spirochaetia bacterium]